MLSFVYSNTDRIAFSGLWAMFLAATWSAKSSDRSSPVIASCDQLADLDVFCLNSGVEGRNFLLTG